jgi:hypothetical protein
MAKKTKTVNQIIAAGVKRGQTNPEILKAVVKAHPYTTMSLATVNWTRNQLRKLNPNLPSNRNATAKR